MTRWCSTDRIVNGNEVGSSSTDGGGGVAIALSSQVVTLTSCKIYGNKMTTSGSGGGVYIKGSSTSGQVNFDSCQIYSNEAKWVRLSLASRALPLPSPFRRPFQTWPACAAAGGWHLLVVDHQYHSRLLLLQQRRQLPRGRRTTGQFKRLLVLYSLPF